MIRKEIGNLFVVGYQGVEPSDDFLKFVEEWGIGGVIVFARNIGDIERLPHALNRIEDAAGKRIFAAIDQEGGLVMRLLQKCSLFQSAMGLAATADIELVEKSHFAMAEEMLAIGLNWNLAPVLDINHPDNPGIGARSFGDKAEMVARYGCAAIRGLQNAGVLACAKHFPGKGNARVDSHLTLPVIEHSREHLENNELLPFKKAITEKVAAIMTAHVFFPAFEETPDLPATLSRSVLTGLLREKMNFSGLLITDDLEMGAITEKYGIAEAASRSFGAGADLLLICHQLEQQKAAAEKILHLVKESDHFKLRLQESLSRIATARNQLNVSRENRSMETIVNNHSGLIEITHKESLRFLDHQPPMLKLKKEDKILFVFPKISALVQVEESHGNFGIGNILQDSFPNSSLIEYEPRAEAGVIIGKAKKEFERTDKLVFFSYNGHLFRSQIEAANVLAKSFADAAAFALRNPYDLLLLTQFSTRGASFSFRTPAIKAIICALQGKIDAKTGPWPIDIADW
jgi:beta-N-acetylhexosaminidase